MSRIDDKLNEIFDVESVEIPDNVPAVIESRELSTTEENVDEKEFLRQKEYVKNNLFDMLEVGKNAVNELAEIARDSEKSRDFEVLFSGIKSMSEVSEKLLDIEQATDKRKASKNGADPVNQTGNVVNNTAVFVGSSAELAKMIGNAIKTNPIIGGEE